TVAGVLATLGLVAFLFRIRGVSGDLVPILEWRWGAKKSLSLERSTSSRSSPAQPLSFTNDYPQYLGPDRNGILTQPHLARDWKAHPPEQLWLRPVGAGWAGFAVVGTRAITLEQRGEEETVICYDLISGAPLWSFGYAGHYDSPIAGEGPRATPTIAANRIFT